MGWIDLIKYWAHENLSAGDQLIFKLERKETYYYGLQKRTLII